MRTQYVMPYVTSADGHAIVTTHNRNGQFLVDHFVTKDGKQGVSATLHQPGYGMVWAVNVIERTIALVDMEVISMPFIPQPIYAR